MSILAQLGRPLVIGHRGAAAHAPENTLPSFELALRSGADALELDVRLSRDRVPVVIHDHTIDRTTDRSGRVAAFDAAELARTDAGYRFRARSGPRARVGFPWRGRGAGVPALADVLAAFPEAQLLIELKETAAQAGVRDAIRTAGAEERCAVGAAEPAALETFRGSRIAVCASRPEIAALWSCSVGGVRPRRIRYDLLSVPVRYRGLPVATRRLFRTAAAAGRPVHVWTVDDPVRAAALWSAGAVGIVTNDPGALRATRPPAAASG